MSLFESCCLNLTSLIKAYADPILTFGYDQPLRVSLGMALVDFVVCYHVVDFLKDKFVKASLAGQDMGRKDKVLIPQGLGVVSGCVFLVSMFLFIPFAVYKEMLTGSIPSSLLMQLLSAILSICCMLLLGFADDVLDLRWRDKLWLPTIASLPLLLVYFINGNHTTIVVPMPLRPCIGQTFDLGILYYLYMGMLAIFCTNAINILAGINGLEAGQSLVIALSVLLHNLVELNGEYAANHLFSLYFILPYIAVCSALLIHNWYPAAVFVGDTFCYFSGMTFAVVAILGHFSKTLLLFFMPQIFNFLFSVPQLFRIVACPRHRLPRYNAATDLREPSTFELPPKPGVLARLILWPLKLLGLVQVTAVPGTKGSDTKFQCTNFTIINLLLVKTGPLHERTLTVVLMLIQVAFSALGFIIRYQVAKLFY